MTNQILVAVIMDLGRDLKDDEYVAELLAKEAKEASKKYSEQGLQALLPKRPAQTFRTSVELKLMPVFTGLPMLRPNRTRGS